MNISNILVKMKGCPITISIVSIVEYFLPINRKIVIDFLSGPIVDTSIIFARQTDYSGKSVIIFNDADRDEIKLLSSINQRFRAYACYS